MTANGLAKRHVCQMAQLFVNVGISSFELDFEVQKV